METTTASSVDRIGFRVARKQAQRLLTQFSHEDTRIEDLCTYYFACMSAGTSRRDALEISSGLIDCSVSTPLVVDSLEEFLSDPSNSIASLYTGLRTGPAPPEISLDGLVYSRVSDVKRVLVGCDEHYDVLEHEVKSLLLYNPRSRTNFERSEHRAILLHGPPGTGKSSLCSYADSYAQMIGYRAQIPVRVDTFLAHDYSKWVGESAQNLQNKLDALSDPSGVGILILEDLDMVFESRSEYASAGGKHVTSTLMQYVSGYSSQGMQNVLVLATTNLASALDPALLRRFYRQIEVPAFSSQQQYDALISRALEWCLDVSSISEYAYSSALSPARTHSLCMRIDAYRRGPICEEVFDVALENREAVRMQSMREVNASVLQSLIDSEA